MIDLHMHTVHSDGFCTTNEVLQLAESRNLSMISITDHNSIGAYGDIESVRGEFGGKIIRGIEINTTFNREIIEILGYGIDLNVMSRFAKENFLSLSEKRQRECVTTLKLYKERGIVLDEERLVFDLKITPKFTFFEEILRHPENESLFVFEDSKHDKNKFLRKEANNPDSPFFVDMTPLFPSIDSVVSAIHEAGGLAFLAHAYAYSPRIPQSLDKIVAYGLDGLECRYSTFTSQQSEEITRYCQEHSLLKSGGSDFHGEDFRPECVMGGLNIPDDFVSDWIDRVEAI